MTRIRKPIDTAHEKLIEEIQEAVGGDTLDSAVRKLFEAYKDTLEELEECKILRFRAEARASEAWLELFRVERANGK